MFLPSAPLMNPRTLCFCQPVAFIISARVAPFLRWIRARTVAFLLPVRALAAPVAAPLTAFVAGLAAILRPAFTAGVAGAAGLDFVALPGLGLAACLPFVAGLRADVAAVLAGAGVCAGLPPSRP